jgi:tripartite-type tricarboxylate transporter receptor subunit TctC
VIATEKRMEDFPDVPTFKELGYDIVGGIDRGITAPAGTPKDRIDKLAAAFRHAAGKKEYIDGMKQQGFELFDLGPAEFATFIKKREAQYREVLKKGGFLTE